MAKNYMVEVAKMLGVEFGELFEVTELGVTYKHYLKPNGLYRVYPDDDQLGKEALPYVLTGILTGGYEFKKLPWMPKEEEHYYYVGWYYSQEKEEFILDVLKGTFLKESALSNLNRFLQNCFKTPEEAESAKYEVFKRLTGKDWAETYGKGGDDNATVCNENNDRRF